VETTLNAYFMLLYPQKKNGHLSVSYFWLPVFFKYLDGHFCPHFPEPQNEL
jgi:hypothetical protein